MIGSRIGISVLSVLLFTSETEGQTAAHYRDFQLGGDLASVSALTGVAPSEAKILHSRPAVLQEMEWRRRYALSGETVEDPVQQIAFSFYNGQLFRLVIDYERDRTEGMTDADMIRSDFDDVRHAGEPIVTTRAPLSTIDAEARTTIAACGNAEYRAVLYRSSYASGFRMVVTSVRLNALARTAEAQALRLDERDAPERERARQKKEADEARALKDKARRANKAAFKP